MEYVLLVPTSLPRLSASPVHRLTFNQGQRGQTGAAVEQFDAYRIWIDLPRGKIETTYKAADPKMMARFPNTANKATVITVRILPDGESDVVGYGQEYHNLDEPVLHEWVNENKPIVEGVRLTDFLWGRTFTILVPEFDNVCRNQWSEDRLAPRFDCPWGDKHTYDVDRYGDQILKARRDQLRQATYLYVNISTDPTLSWVAY